MERLKVQILDVGEKQSGYSEKYQKEWELQKIKVRVLESSNANLVEKELESLFWGKYIRYIPGARLAVGAICFFDGELKKSHYSKQLELHVKYLEEIKLDGKDKEKILEVITDDLAKDWYELNKQKPTHPLAVMALAKNISFSVIDAYVKFHPQEVNYLDNQGFSAAMYFVKRAINDGEDNFFEQFLSLPNLDFNLKTPRGSSLVDLVLFSTKSKLQDFVYKKVPEQIFVLNSRENRKVFGTPLANLLVKEKLVLNNLSRFNSEAVLEISTLEQLISLVDSKYSKAIVKELVTKVKVKKGSAYTLDYVLLDIISKLLAEGIDINHVQTILAHGQELGGWDVFFNFKKILETNKVEFTQFLLNNLELTDKKKTQQQIKDTHKAYLQFKKERE